VTLVEFLLARIAEDEAVARAAVTDGEAGWEASEEEFGTFHVGHRSEKVWRWPYLGEEKARHIARHDPARVLAECDAKRKVVEAYQGLWGLAKVAPVEQRDTARNMYAGIEIAMQCLALPYAGHADYDEGWRP
jgi:hypothetical protein